VPGFAVTCPLLVILPFNVYVPEFNVTCPPLAAVIEPFTLYVPELKIRFPWLLTAIPPVNVLFDAVSVPPLLTVIGPQ
jgi:hypothetical protein